MLGERLPNNAMSGEVVRCGRELVGASSWLNGLMLPSQAVETREKLYGRRYRDDWDSAKIECSKNSQNCQDYRLGRVDRLYLEVHKCRNAVFSGEEKDNCNMFPAIEHGQPCNSVFSLLSAYIGSGQQEDPETSVAAVANRDGKDNVMRLELLLWMEP